MKSSTPTDGISPHAGWGHATSATSRAARLTLVSGVEEISGRATSALVDDKTFSARAARSLPRPEGAFGYWGLTPVAFDDDHIRTKGADNLASCAAILAVMDRLNREKANADFWGVFTRAEEVGLLGAGGIVRARSVPRRVPIIVLETSKALPGAEIGGGTRHPRGRCHERLRSAD